MIFENNSTCPQEPVSVQRLLFLYFTGFSGIGKSFESCRERYGYSIDMAENAVHCVSTSLYFITGDYIKWPYREWKKKMRAEIEQNKVSSQLAFAPSFEKEAFFGGKKDILHML